MKLAELAAPLPFRQWSHADEIRFFGWFIHRHLGRDFFSSSEISRCYDDLALAKPANISAFLRQMSAANSRQMLRSREGYRLERNTLEKLDSKFGIRPITVHVIKLLEELPAKVPDVAEREFLREALISYRSGAFRAAVLMSWIVAFDHLLSYVLAHRLDQFNRQWPKTFSVHHQKARVQEIRNRDDFAELKESQVITICKSAAIITGDMCKILEEKLGKRNSAAHPSTVTIGQIQAEGVIDDLVNNIILRLVI